MGWNENIALAESTQHHTCNHNAAVKEHSQNRALFKSAFSYNCKLFTVLSTKLANKITTSDDVLAYYNLHKGDAPLFSHYCAIAFKWRLCNKSGTCGPAKCKASSIVLSPSPERQYLQFFVILYFLFSCCCCCYAQQWAVLWGAASRCTWEGQSVRIALQHFKAKRKVLIC